MTSRLKNWFALTDTGAKELQKSIFANFLVYLINLAPAILVMLFADQLLLAHQKSDALYYVLSVLTLIVMYFLINFEYDASFNATYHESANLRIELAQTLQKLPLSYFSKNNLSDLSQSIMADVDGLEHAISHSIPKALAMIFFFPIIALLLFMGNFYLALAVILPSLLSFILIPLSKKASVRGNKRYYDELRENSELFQETIELAQDIKSFNLSDKVNRTLSKKMEESEKVHIKSELTTIISLSLASLFSYLGLASVILVGSYLLTKGDISVLYLLGYLLASIKLKDAFDNTKEALLEIFYLNPKVARLKELYAHLTDDGDFPTLKHFSIELNDVTFSYQKEVPILTGVTFTANQGEVTALVGASGSGKTSLLRIISKLYDYDGGKISIDGIDLKTMASENLFQYISIVFQDVILFNTSIRENIRLGRKDATDEEVETAAKLANCTEFISKLENGFDTIIGENGAELSGGQRQRLSIARAFLKNAPILILDEISASLDVANENKIQESLNTLIKDKTVIIISHRLKSIENVDKIVVLNQGKVEAFGKHNDLLTTSKTYKNLIEKTNLAQNFVY